MRSSGDLLAEVVMQTCLPYFHRHATHCKQPHTVVSGFTQCTMYWRQQSTKFSHMVCTSELCEPFNHRLIRRHILSDVDSLTVNICPIFTGSFFLNFWSISGNNYPKWVFLNCCLILPFVKLVRSRMIYGEDCLRKFVAVFFHRQREIRKSKELQKRSLPSFVVAVTGKFSFRVSQDESHAFLGGYHCSLRNWNELARRKWSCENTMDDFYLGTNAKVFFL